MSSPHPSHSPLSGQEEISIDRSAESSAPSSRGGSRRPLRSVRFTPGGESLDASNNRTAFDVRDESDIPTRGHIAKPAPRPTTRTRHDRAYSSAVAPTRSSLERNKNPPDLTNEQPVEKSRPPTMSGALGDFDEKSERPRGRRIWRVGDDGREYQALQDEDEDEDEVTAAGKAFSQQSAQGRAERLSRIVGSDSAPGSRFASPERAKIKPPLRSPPPSPPAVASDSDGINLNDIQLEQLETRRTKYGIDDPSDDEAEEGRDGQKTPKNRFRKAARRLVRHHTKAYRNSFRFRADTPPLQSGQATPEVERDSFNYVQRPKEYREGFLTSLLRLYNEQGVGPALAHIPREFGSRNTSRVGSAAQSLLGSTATTPTQTPGGSPETSGIPTPKTGDASPQTTHQKWYSKKENNRSTGSISDLVSSSTVFAQLGVAESANSHAVRPKSKHRPRSSQALSAILGKKKKGLRHEDSIRIQIHIAETIQRHGFLVKMCRALMEYGAPTHRLEEYMRMSARVLEIDGQFLYMPGCMLISFDDASTHTTEVKLIRSAQAVNLGKLMDTHEVYKKVVHDHMGVEDAIDRLEEISSSKARYSPWFLVFVYGCASACVGPFAFGAGPFDLPIAFFLGCILGIMQLIWAPRSDLYSNIFEISAAVATSFLARAFGSIQDGNHFCFSALAQSSIALILPGYTVLCASLELQSRNIVAGSVRIVYAIIYSLFLGFGITIGTSIYGAIDHNATSATSCKSSMPMWYSFIFVPPFTLCLIVINQGKIKQMPAMLVIAFAGYVVNSFSASYFKHNAQIANTFGALAIGLLGNTYSRKYHGLAAATMLPAIFVQVPSGLAASGSLISGVTSANQITNHTANGALSNGTTVVNNGTQAGSIGIDMNTAVLNVGYSMIQVTIGITVGLFISALILYPFGKRRSGLFSF